jgi:hypothetical protein
MEKKRMFINVLLLVMAVLMGWYVRGMILRYNSQANMTEASKPGKVVPDGGMPLPNPPNAWDSKKYSIIADKTLFSENRTNAPELIPAPPAPPPEIPPLAQKPILVGTAISENMQTAWIIDPAGNPKAAPAGAQNTGRRAQIKKVGDTYQGYAITSIADDTIVLANGPRTEIIPLYEGSKQAKGGKTAIQATRVVSFGGKTAGGMGGTPAAGSSISGLVAVAPINQPIQGERSLSTPTMTAPIAQQAAVRSSQQGQPFNFVGVNDLGQRVFQTPFGPVTER